MLSVINITPDEFFARPELPALLEEYQRESLIEGMPKPNAKLEIYKQMGSAIHALGAFLDDTFIGFVVVLSPVIPHYGILISSLESFFVAQGYRTSGAGMVLLRRAEDHARGLKSPGMLVSAPAGSSLDQLLEHSRSYKHTNNSYFRRFE